MYVTVDGKLLMVGPMFADLDPDVPPEPQPEPEFIRHNRILRIEDVYPMVQAGERIVIVTRHAARGSDTSITGDLSTTGINQCITLGKKLSNPNVDLSKAYIGGSLKYRALNTAYQITKAMGVAYPDDYDYLTDTDSYQQLMEVNFFMDANGESSGIDLDVNAYYSYVDDTIYTGANKVDDHVNTKSREVIDMMIAKAAEKDADLAWFGTHDKVIIPLLAYTTDRTRPIHVDRSDADVDIKIKNPTTGASTGTWSIPLLGGIAFIVNKSTGAVNVYPFDSGF